MQIFRHHIYINLNWDKHIECIFSKACIKLWFLRRTLKPATFNVKLTTYIVLHSAIEHTNIICFPWTQLSINKPGALENKTGGFMTNKYDSATHLACSLPLPSLINPAKTKSYTKYSRTNCVLRKQHPSTNPPLNQQEQNITCI